MAQEDSLIEAYRKYFPVIVGKCARMLSDTGTAEEMARRPSHGSGNLPERSLRAQWPWVRWPSAPLQLLQRPYA